MLEGMIENVYTLLPWLFILMAILLGMPVGYDALKINTISYQLLQLAKTGDSLSDLQTKAQTLMNENVQTQTSSGATLFSSLSDLTIDTSNPPYVTVTITYHEPILYEITHWVGWTGPTFAMKIHHTGKMQSSNNQGIPSSL